MPAPITISFFARGEPKGQPRPRAFAFRGKARVFDPGTAEAWKQAVVVALREQCGLVTPPITVPIQVGITLYFPRPKSHFRTGKNAHLRRDDAPVFHTAKPDADNAAKAILDALTIAELWKDDAQVCRLSVIKLYADGHAGAQIDIQELEPTP